MDEVGSKEQDIVLEPELVWEGADLGKNKSVMGAITERVENSGIPAFLKMMTERFIYYIVVQEKMVLEL